jgi:hypothetical protein
LFVFLLEYLLICLVIRFDILFISTTIVGQFLNLYESYTAFIEIFTPFANAFAAYQTKRIPTALKELMEATQTQIAEKINSALKLRKPLVYKDFRPVPLKSLTPDFISKYVHA